MPDKYKNKYRIESARAPFWDYTWNAAYFVTICTKNREHYFGEIVNGAMEFSKTGKMANEYWLKIPEHFPFVKLDEFVVMPNHVHGIIVIDRNNNVQAPKLGASTAKLGYDAQTPKLGASTAKLGYDAQTPKLGYDAQTPKLGVSNKIVSEKWKSGSLGVIINQYKRACTIYAKKIHTEFAWQSRFYDHIIRNDESYKRIKNYIINNPKNWNSDKINTDLSK
jgi:REP element-mobilizing transposase RayT